MTPEEPENDKLELAARNLGNVTVVRPGQFHVPHLLRNNLFLVSKQALVDLEQVLDSRHANYYRNRKVSRPEHIAAITDAKMDPFHREIIKPTLEAESIEGFDDSKPVTILSESLKSYIDDLRRLQYEAEERSHHEEATTEEAQQVEQQ